ncbi:MAG TPA: YidB family protein [Thermodesulfovibrionales bacterium]|nr:YidB family protein [Thermodesulfovibrionales bacterium]
MGLLDGLAGGLAGKLFGSGEHNKLFESITGLINNPQIGGLSGLVQMFKDKGLADAVLSWVSTGKNIPVSPDQIRQALGAAQIQQIADKAGISQEEASKGVAGLLPDIIDKLTPDGKLPQGDMIEKGLSMLKEQFFRK